MRIAIDGDLCQGTGECRAIVGSAIEFDDVGTAVLVSDEFPDDIAARLINTCPSMAISLAD